MNDSLSKLKIKSVESVVIYDADGNELLKLVPSLDPIGVELTLDEEIKKIERKTQLPKAMPPWAKSQEQIAKALKEIVWRLKEEKENESVTN